MPKILIYHGHNNAFVAVKIYKDPSKEKVFMN
jgi:hypothetical protein